MLLSTVSRRVSSSRSFVANTAISPAVSTAATNRAMRLSRSFRSRSRATCCSAASSRCFVHLRELHPQRISAAGPVMPPAMADVVAVSALSVIAMLDHEAPATDAGHRGDPPPRAAVRALAVGRSERSQHQYRCLAVAADRPAAQATVWGFGGSASGPFQAQHPIESHGAICNSQ